MTRINCVPVQELTDAHLGAEYRELPRIFALARAAYLRGELPTDPRNPTEYTLGKGHVRFFYARLGWLRKRFLELVAECHHGAATPPTRTSPDTCRPRPRGGRTGTQRQKPFPSTVPVSGPDYQENPSDQSLLETVHHPNAR